MEQTQKKKLPFFIGIAGFAIAGYFAGKYLAENELTLFPERAAEFGGAFPVALGLAGFYLLIGAILLIVALVPKIAPFVGSLTAEDTEDMRPAVLYSAGAMFTWGAALAVVLSESAQGWLVAVLLVAGLVFTYMSHRTSDELFRRTNVEATGVAYYLVSTTLIVWSFAAVVTDLAAPDPLAILCVFYGAAMLATFIASARRGLLTD